MQPQAKKCQSAGSHRNGRESRKGSSHPLILLVGMQTAECIQSAATLKKNMEVPQKAKNRVAI